MKILISDSTKAPLHINETVTFTNKQLLEVFTDFGVILDV